MFCLSWSHSSSTQIAIRTVSWVSPSPHGVGMWGAKSKTAFRKPRNTLCFSFTNTKYFSKKVFNTLLYLDLRQLKSSKDKIQDKLEFIQPLFIFLEVSVVHNTCHSDKPISDRTAENQPFFHLRIDWWINQTSGLWVLAITDLQKHPGISFQRPMGYREGPPELWFQQKQSIFKIRSCVAVLGSIISSFTLVSLNQIIWGL